MKKFLLAIFLIIFIAVKPAHALEVIYPKDGDHINAYSTFFVGNTECASCLKINNQRVKVYDNGAFVHVVELKPGENTITLHSYSDSNSKKLVYTIFTPENEKTIPQQPLLINQKSVQPTESVIYKPGDLLQVSFKGSTGNKAYFSIGKKRKNIPMMEQPPKYITTAPVYGKASRRSTAPVKGIYKGTYRIQQKDDFNNENVNIKLVSHKDRINYELPITVSTISQDSPPQIAMITTHNAVIRTYPGKSRLTPLPEGTLITLTGKIGDDLRFKMGESLEGWVSEKDVTMMPEGTPALESSIQLIDIIPNENIVYFKIPLAQKHPFIIEQPFEKELYLKIFGVKADIDMFSYDKKDEFIKEVKWTQETKNSVKLNIKTNARQFWGYKYYYEGDTLVLEFKKPPVIDPGKPLDGIVICLDPGHGGEEDGVIGPTGIPEKQVNLEISMKLKELLERRGANVVMTRTLDEAVDLYDRVKFANYNDAQILLSIHNNSLPDGRDPHKEHGTSTYYYHSQSLPLAKILHNALLEDIEFEDFGLFWSSFALTRPNETLAVLLELGFLINPVEYSKLTTPEFQDKVAESIARGLTYFLFVNSGALDEE